MKRCSRAAARWLAFTSLTSLALASASQAQQADATASAATTVAEQQTPQADASQIDDIVVTARRTNENLQDVPVAVTAVSAQQLNDLSVRDVLEIQKVAPGLFVSAQGSGGRAKFTIRGQSEADSRLTTDGSVGLYIDGVPITRTYGIRSSFIDIAQVEVLKGPQGTLFGKNTTGGALNITTQHPTYDRGGYLDLLYGSYNNRQALGVLNLPIVDDRLAIRATLQRVVRDGYGTDLTGRDLGDDDVFTGRLQLRADPTDALNIALSGDYTRQDIRGSNSLLSADAMLANANTATRGLGAIARERGLNPASAADRLTAYQAWRGYYDLSQQGDINDGYSDLDVFDKLTHWGVSATETLDVGSLTFKSTTSFRRVHTEKLQDIDGTPFDLLNAGNDTSADNFTQELQVSSIDGEGLDWQLGVFYNNEEGTDLFTNNSNTAVNTSNASVTEADVKNTSTAVYGQAVYALTSQVRVTAGLRYTQDTREEVSHNRVDSSLAVPAVPGTTGRCNLLSPALGGPTFPNCSYGASVDFDALTYLLSVDWRPTDDFLAYASTSTGYRAGGFTEAANNAVITSQAQLDLAFTPFAPEKVQNYEVGFKSDWFAHRLRLNGAVYYQDYTDIQAQIRDFAGAAPVTLIRNAASATIYGAELEVTAKPTESLTLRGGAGYTHPRYDEYTTRDNAGNVLDLSAQRFAVPTWTYNLGAAHETPVRGGALRINANYSFIGETQLRPDTPTLASVTQEGFGLLDARVTWVIDALALDISIFGKNLTDESYITGATNIEGSGWNVVTPGDPRTFGVQVRKTF